MDTNATESQRIEALEQGSVEQAFWCEPVRFGCKEEIPPSNDSPCNGDDNCSGCNGNPNCSYGCA